jgi:hypothetical protein
MVPERVEPSVFPAAFNGLVGHLRRDLRARAVEAARVLGG